MDQKGTLITQKLTDEKSRERTPIVNLDLPVYAMATPLGFLADSPNNQPMADLSEEERIIDKDRAMSQWLSLYNYLASQGLVYLIPTPQQKLQDLVFASNLAVSIDDFKKDIIVVANFAVKERIGETEVGRQFFESLGCETYVCPFKFEGDAELKKIGPKLYVGAYGQRSDIKAYEWMEEKFGIKIIKVNPNNKNLYHLDCNFLPITREDAIICSESFTKEDIKKLEGQINLHDVPTVLADYGASSLVRVHTTVIADTCIDELDSKEEAYELENEKLRFLEDIVNKCNLDLTLIPITEFYKGGAAISCLVMQLNRYSYCLDLI